MSSFFDDYFNLKKIMEGKRAYRQHMARVKALPVDYQYVFQSIQNATWQHTAGAGYDMMELHSDLLALFEENAAAGKPVLEVTGEDVAGFVEELLKSVRTRSEDSKTRFNCRILKHVEHG